MALVHQVPGRCGFCRLQLATLAPTRIQVEDPLHPVCKGVPESFIAPANEWYRFSPGLRENPKVQVLASVAAESFPLGISRIFESEDLPIAWQTGNTAWYI